MWIEIFKGFSSNILAEFVIQTSYITSYCDETGDLRILYRYWGISPVKSCKKNQTKKTKDNNKLGALKMLQIEGQKYMK